MKLRLLLLPMTVFWLGIAPAHAEPLRLDDALRDAARQALSIQRQETEIAARDAERIAADALPDPKAVLGIENLPVSGPDRFRTGADGMTMRKYGLMQEFPNAAKRSARREAAEARQAQARTAMAGVQAQVAGEAADAWLALDSLRAQLTLLADLEAENRLWGAVMNAQLASGKASAAEALLPRQEALALAARRDGLERDRRKAEARLTRLLGRPGPFEPDGDAPEYPVDPVRLREHLRHHPALAVYDPMTALATAELHEAEAAQRPDWGVGLTWQQRGRAYDDMISMEVTVDLPLFPRQRQTPLITARRAALAGLDSERRDAEREHAADLESDLADYAALDRQAQRLSEEAQPLARQRLGLLTAAYAAGRADPAQLLAARRELHELRLEALATAGERRRLAARLHFQRDPQPREDTAP